MNILQRFSSWILSFFKSQKYKPYKSKPLRTKYKGYCEHCGQKESTIDAFYCKYCKQWHCTEHRLPEDHECGGNVTKPKELDENTTPIGYRYKKK